MFASWFTTKKLDWGVVLVFFNVHLGSFSSEMQFLNDDEHELPSLQAAVGKKVNPSGYVDSSLKVDRRDNVLSRGNT